MSAITAPAGSSPLKDSSLVKDSSPVKKLSPEKGKEEAPKTTSLYELFRSAVAYLTADRVPSPKGYPVKGADGETEYVGEMVVRNEKGEITGGYIAW